MGLLSNGTPLPWEEAKKYSNHVKSNGIEQLLNIWRSVRERRKDCLLWGDEVEYLVVAFDDEKKEAKLFLRADESLKRLQEIENEAIAASKPLNMSWKPEYAKYMLEGTPGIPYGATITSLMEVEPNMRYRRHMAYESLKDLARDKETLAPITLTVPLMLGTSDFSFMEPWTKPTPLIRGDEDVNSKALVASGSLYISDSLISSHPRFSTLTRNIRHRRQEKVCINVPIFRDRNTPQPFKEPLPPSIASQYPSETTLPDVVDAAKENHIYMDAMGFGMGCCCLQITFQACSIEEARSLYDQLAVFAPLMLALTASSPIFKGYLSDVDCRWDVIAASVDDRTRAERGLEPDPNVMQIPKSRYDSVSSFLGPGSVEGNGDYLHKSPLERAQLALSPLIKKRYLSPRGSLLKYWNTKYNDTYLVHDPDIYTRMLESGVDPELARHYAHLFIRDPMVIYGELLDQDNEKTSDHFENIQSTNWQTMRFKPPPANTAQSTGWRVEFRSMEVQLSDFENAAFSVFIVALVRVILSFGPNFYIPISKVDDNMRRAQRRGACLDEMFWFRRSVFTRSRDEAMADFVDQSMQSSFCHLNSEFSSDWSQPAIPMYADFRKNCCPSPADTQSKYSFEGVNSGSPSTPASMSELEDARDDEDAGDEFVLMSLDEIFNGSRKHNFVGILPLVHTYISNTESCPKMKAILNRYWSLLSKRASGELKTPAAYWRQFVESHPSYKQDSKVPKDVIYEICKQSAAVGNGSVSISELTGNLQASTSPEQ